MTRPEDDTIFAIASGAGRAAIAVLRLSGPAVRAIVKSLAGKLPEPHTAALATFRDPATGDAIDKGFVIFFPAPKTYTGEDYAEFHVHGGRAVVAAMVKALGGIAGARPAEPGEFTRRALLNDKMDLAEVEGLADLIDAETEWQRRAALRQSEGVLGRQAAIWRSALLEAAALLEAEIDFSEEEDVPGFSGRRAGEILGPVLAGLKSELAAGRAGERLREGVAVVIAGPPNAGKSTLLNALVRRDVAIVSPFAGTTRDLIEVHLDLGGCPVTLIDTAGLRESFDAVEKIGVFRTRDKARVADLVLVALRGLRPRAARCSRRRGLAGFYKERSLSRREKAKRDRGALYKRRERRKSRSPAQKNGGLCPRGGGRRPCGLDRAGAPPQGLRDRGAGAGARFGRSRRSGRNAGGGLARGDGFAAKTDRRGGRRGHFG